MSTRRKKRNKMDSIETQTTPGIDPMSPLLGSIPIPPFELVPIEIGIQTDKDKDKDREKDIEKDIEINDVYTEKDVEYIKRIKRKNPILYYQFIQSKNILKDRSVILSDILEMNITFEKKATLLEKYECLQQLIPYSHDYIVNRNQLRNLCNRFLSKKLVSEDPDIEMFSTRLKEMVTSFENRAFIEEKIEEYQESEQGDEKSKLKRWLTLATLLPFDKMSTVDYDIIHKLQETRNYLDSVLFGMKAVKERLLIFLNKKLRTFNGSRGCNIALLGKPGVGKCLHPDTALRMADLSIKHARDIVIGDELLGDDSTTRLVSSVCGGMEEMFEIIQEYGDRYIVNRSHILTVLRKNDEKVIDIPLVEVFEKEYLYSPLSGYYNGNVRAGHDAISYGLLYRGETNVPNYPDNFPLLPNNCIEWTVKDKLVFFNSLTNSGRLNSIYISPIYPIHSIYQLLRSAAIRCIIRDQTIILMTNSRYENFRIRSLGQGEYCGFSIDENHRFLLGDWTVTHNTAIAKALSKCLNVPFSQVSFGGVTSPEFLLGHDYTYIGSRPGEITRCLSRMGTKNGILFFDEFDKASDRKEIMSTLLHVTDFSQNNEFRDNYFPELCQDLGKIWFIYSMNELPKDPAMLDRLEVIKVDGYSFQEKKTIAKEYLFPKFSKELKIENDFTIDEDALHTLIQMDNSEGVRHLERSINLLMEKIYFFLYNKEMNYDYVWFKKMKELFSKGVLHVTEELINNVLTKQELESFNSIYN